LQQGRIGLVRDALRERGRLCRNAPHLVHPLATIVPLHSRWEAFYYGLGLKMYDMLSGRWRLGSSERLSNAEALARIPTLETSGLYGAVMYLDGAFDDSRLLVNLAQTAIEAGALCLNYMPVRALDKVYGRVVGVVTENIESGRTYRVAACVVVNATGPFTDTIRRLDEPKADPTIAPSQGIHLVFGRDFMPGETALIVPKTRDGRVVFAIPWHQHVVVGTTDTSIDNLSLEPRPQPAEIEFLLETISPYWSHKPQTSDVRSIFAGVRPLVRSNDSRRTAELGRDHVIRVSAAGLVSITGGKWTTYRKMAEDVINRAAEVAGLLRKPCRTHTLLIHGADGSRAAAEYLAGYGSDGAALEQLASSHSVWSDTLHADFPYTAAQVVWASRNEMARTVEDVLARRLRMLFLDARAAVAACPRVAELLAGELGYDDRWQAEQIRQFTSLAELYQLSR
jgi:glycerol-3-phosphate dehydrogenase